MALGQVVLHASQFPRADPTEIFPVRSAIGATKSVTLLDVIRVGREIQARRQAISCLTINRRILGNLLLQEVCRSTLTIWSVDCSHIVSSAAEDKAST